MGEDRGGVKTSFEEACIVSFSSKDGIVVHLAKGYMGPLLVWKGVRNFSGMERGQPCASCLFLTTRSMRYSNL